jgi:hypothetical protein
MLSVAQLPFPLGECTRNEMRNVCDQIDELHYQHDIEAKELAELADPDNRLPRLGKELLKEIKKSDVDREAECRSHEEQKRQLLEKNDSTVH